MPILPEKPKKGLPIPNEWFQRFYDYVRSLKPSGDGRTIMVQHMPNGVTISSNISPGAGGGGGGDTYNGQFKVSKKSTTEITVDAGYVIAGATSLLVAEVDVTIADLMTALTHVYLKVTYNIGLGVYEAEYYQTTNAYEPQTATEYFVLICDVSCDSGTIVGQPIQQQFGPIHVAGRAV